MATMEVGSQTYNLTPSVSLRRGHKRRRILKSFRPSAQTMAVWFGDHRRCWNLCCPLPPKTDSGRSRDH